MSRKSEKAQILWNSGIPLTKAPEEFCDENLRAEIHALKQGIPPARMQGMVKQLEEFKPDNFLEKAIKFISPVVLTMNSYSELQGESRKQLLDQLISEQLIAIGFQFLPSRRKLPEIIPHHIFDNARIDWGNSSCHGAILEFSSVRICRNDSPKSRKVAIDPPQINPKPTVMGRPSKRHEIEKALRELWADGKIGSGTAQKTIVKEIRGRILGKDKELNFAEPGLSDTTIMKTYRQVRKSGITVRNS